jgi:hypothetical protein
MLHKDRILRIGDTNQDRLGLLSSRSVDLFTRDGGIGKEGQDYIYNKVGEVVTGITTERIFGFTENYDWQISIEPDAISKFAEIQETGQYIIHSPVISDETIFIAEPSAIWLRGLNQKNADEYIVEPIQCKCPREFSQFIRYISCQSPKELKKFSPKYYWRMLDNMLICNAIKGHFFIFHPVFEQSKNYHTIIFDRISLLEDMNFLKKRKMEAAALYKAAIEKMTNKD